MNAFKAIEKYEVKSKSPQKKAQKLSKSVKVTCFDISQPTSEGKATCGILISGNGLYDLRQWLQQYVPVWISLSNLKTDFHARERQLF
jgi:hypothetical protein